MILFMNGIAFAPRETTVWRNTADASGCVTRICVQNHAAGSHGGPFGMGGRKKMLIVVGVLFSIIVSIAAFFHLPFSKTRTDFTVTADRLLAEAETKSGGFTEEEIAGLPSPVQKYFRHCGYIGTPKMSHIKIDYHDVDFSFGRDKPAIKIDYTQYDFVNGPDRVAYIGSTMYGIPFEGLDSFLDGSGSMKGVLAKQFTLFDQTGAVMDQSALVTYLSEILLVPSAALQDYVKWEAVDSFHAKATITCYGISAAGVFSFDEEGAMLAFTTDDRSAVSTDGSSEKIKWSVICDAYTEVNGIRRPTVFRAVWHYSDGDLVYFDGAGTITAYE